MIINALADAYDRLCSSNDAEIKRDGYSFESVPFIATIDADGMLTDLISNTKSVVSNGKSREVIKTERIPERLGRTSVIPNYLCDTFSYVFGLEVVSAGETEKYRMLLQTDKAKKSHDSFKEKILNDLKNVPGGSAASILKFYENWNPEQEKYNELFFYCDKNGEKKLKDLKGIVIFALNSVNNKSIDDTGILNKWEELFQSAADEMTEKSVIGQCCVSGKDDVIARKHFPVKGVLGTQPSGAAIVSYNSPSFESYNKVQSFNGPISENVMRKYTGALNYFLQKDSKNKIVIGNETFVFWAECDNVKYVDEIWDLLGSKPTESEEKTVESRVMSALKLIRDGQAPISFDVKDNTRFHLLILSPNAGRISVRRYYNTTLGAFRTNILKHHADMMLSDSKGEFKQIPLWRIPDATISSAITKGRNSKVNPNFTGSLFEAVINNHIYPSALFAEMIARVKTDHANSDDKQKAGMLANITNTRIAFIKAYLIRKNRKNIEKEEINLELNKNISGEAYLLGRLFAVMERTQQEAIPKLSSTIKDRFFASASSMPASVFPSLLKGYQNHVSKLEKKGIRFERLLDEIIAELGDSFPKQLDMDKQGSFILGYYQQRVDLWKKKNTDD